MKKICVITATRAEYGLLYPLISKIEADSELELQLIVSGTHLSELFGYTKNEIIKDGFSIAKEIEILSDGNDACAVSESMAKAVAGFAQFLKNDRPDMAVILGDRYEMLAFAIALVNERIPIAHLNGGETTEGALDEGYRHCLTKLSMLHFANCEVHRKRIIQLGEEPSRVFNVGDTCIDNIMNEELVSPKELEKYLGIPILQKQTAIVTYHPVTTEDDSLEQLEEMLSALQDFPELQLVFTMANADSGGMDINKRLEEFVQMRDNAILVDSLGRKRFLSLLKHSVMMIGNSSSGIYEAPAFHIPTINIGNRQKGRLHGDTVIDCTNDKAEIVKAMQKALTSEFQEKCRQSENIFGDGHASEQIVSIMKDFLKKDVSVQKRFYDL